MHQNRTSSLSSHVSLMGTVLGKTIANAQGQEVLNKVEEIRGLAKAARKGDDLKQNALVTALHNLSDQELLPIARSFSQFLNLANVAEQHHSVAKSDDTVCSPNPLRQALLAIKQHVTDQAGIQKAIEELSIDLVLTAHPTEVTRRTLIHKHIELNDCLEQLDIEQGLKRSQEATLARIDQLIAQAWYTNEIRNQRPTPVDEAKWGFAVIENSLWQAVPNFIKELEAELESQLDIELPLDFAPITLTSWMGGDRDGNPFVTAKVTEQVLDLGRWVSLNLFLEDISQLTSELSMSTANDSLKQLTQDHHEPYRQVLGQLKADIAETRDYLTAKIQGVDNQYRDLITLNQQLLEPLKQCYQSLIDCDMKVIADGLLIDTIRRVNCFGLNLVRLDIRQDSDRHTDVFSELSRYLGLGDYAQWQESDRQAFLLRELNSRRPLLPRDWQPSADVKEVLDTFKVIAAQPEEKLGIYIISMARQASDVLAVELLLKESGCQFNLPVAPLFETLDDLDASAEVMAQLYTQDWYRGNINSHQYVMIGYSDSAKDAGMMAAGWAQYRAMEELVALSEQHQIKLTLFHGRGGTVGRGGAPAAQGIRSQPPGSLKGGFRVTEQGEMIRFKFGIPEVAMQSLSLYAGAVLEGNLLPPPVPEESWRLAMDEIAAVSCQHYRSVVREEPDFVPYFRQATPEQELGKLPLGSRPAKRKLDGGVESLRAIPWIFAWSQTRLMLPAWLGALQGLQAAESMFDRSKLEEMSQHWPFFKTRLEMLEMVFCKADVSLSQRYEEALVDENLKHLGQSLRDDLAQAIEWIQGYCSDGELLATQPWVKQSIELRNPYIDPLNVLQIELLRRLRSESAENPALEQALMVTIAGIAAGLRNTG